MCVLQILADYLLKSIQGKWVIILIGVMGTRKQFTLQ